jgi:hypothetical protein
LAARRFLPERLSWAGGPERTNPNGSGVSLGHPIAATGTILAVKAIYELRQTGGTYALVIMCIGAGQGIAAIFERMSPANPPARRPGMRRRAQPADPARWREAAERHDGSWWQDWAGWADARAGRLIPPPTGSDRYPALVGAAPGDYVRG